MLWDQIVKLWATDCGDRIRAVDRLDAHDGVEALDFAAGPRNADDVIAGAKLELLDQTRRDDHAARLWR